MRENAACPYCNSLERTRLLNYYLINETDIFSGNKSILHFAPEYTLAKQLKKSSKNYISADIEKCVANIVEDIQSLTFEDNKFDYIICSCVLGHVPDEISAIKEIKRVLKAGGKAFILTLLNIGTYKTLEDKHIITYEDRLKHYGEGDLLRLHGEDFLERLNIPNTVVEKIDYSTKFTKEEKTKYSLGNKERELIFCLKKTL
ncbi:class I SAM-dependent methyltransferase [Pedobacter alpinus]|uniref:class I SAM-dependent methyltransferase n=1 Tax=Pedobacter alpinus TaxID=1590643 RepID=UPI00360D301D